MNGTGVDTLNKRRLATCSLIEDDIGELQARLGPRERNRLQRHYDSIKQMEMRLMQTPPMPMGSCMVPAMPTDSSNGLTNNRMHLDLIINAFACDITRVAGIHYGNDQSLKVDLPSVPLAGNQHGDFIHTGMKTRATRGSRSSRPGWPASSRTWSSSSRRATRPTARASCWTTRW